VTGVVVVAASTAFTLWARAALGTMWTASPAAKDTHVLRTGGPYAITRHPIYTGMLGMLLGTAVAAGLGRWLAVFVAGVAWAEIRIHAEERFLTELFPRDYERYRRQVPQLTPGLHGLPAPRRGASPRRHTTERGRSPGGEPDACTRARQEGASHVPAHGNRDDRDRRSAD
jgi:Phospholipid methyltransferase